MPTSKTKTKNAAIAARMAALPSIPKELIDQFVSGPMTGEAVNEATAAFKKALIERALGAEMSHHLGYLNGASKPESSAANQRNGRSAKTLLTDDGPLRIDVPRDRAGSFEPVLIPKHERRFTGFDDKIVAMYARGMTMREIQGFLLESYGWRSSPEFISSVTDAVMAEVSAWQARPLEPMYPVVFFDALRVKIKEDAVVRNKAIYLALGVLPDGTRDILGLWIEGTEGAKFWMKVFNDLKTRGVNDMLIAVTDGLKGMPEALGGGVSGHHATDVHRAPDSQLAGLRELEGPQAAGRGASGRSTRLRAPRRQRPNWTPSRKARGACKFPTVVAAWRRAWDRVIPFFAFPPSIRRVIYTTNAIESINARLRKIIKRRRADKSLIPRLVAKRPSTRGQKQSLVLGPRVS